MDYYTLLILPNGQYAIQHEPMFEEESPPINLSDEYTRGEWFKYNGFDYYVIGKEDVKDFR